MKKFILAFSLLALAACSSAPKEEEAPTEAPAVSEAPVAQPEPAPEAKADMSADSGVNMEGGFPDVEGTERSGATCKNGGDERMVSVIDTREKTCGVVYTKQGNKRTVAYARFDMGFCDKVFDNIVGNLKNGGFDCGGAQATSNGAAAAPAPTGEKEEAPAEAAEGGE